ncbi:methyltransferase [Pontixanthobacter sp.]|uniref:methyltransferase n=1 Tax=Pontixanthobacter sp. TaxID=2792078 RepID=UPI003C79E482
MSKISDSSFTTLSWRTRLVLRRNRILGSLKFQNWAAKVPVFRMVARRKAAGQFDLIAGFVYSQITYVFVQSDLIGFLASRPRNFSEIVDFLGLSPAATERIVKAGAALKLSESPQDDVWTLGEVGAAMAVNDGVMAMIRHHALLYRDLVDPLALMSQQGGVNSELSAFWTYASDTPDSAEAAAPYSDLMRATQPMVWQQILGRYPFSRHQKILDIGGGSGAFAEAVGTSAPNVQLGVFDLPGVAPLARDRFAGSPLQPRVQIHSGSFREDALPRGYDLITLIRVLHDHDDAAVQALLAKVFESLPTTGRLLIVEPMAETRGAEGMGDAYFGLYLWAMGSGRPRSFKENAKMAKEAGFSSVREISTPLPLIAKALIAIK